MNQYYLEVTYRKGIAVAAYYYLPRRDGDASARTERAEGGLVIDYASDGRAIGIEITCPSLFDPSQLNRTLERLGHAPAAKEELSPLVAA